MRRTAALRSLAGGLVGVLFASAAFSQSALERRLRFEDIPPGVTAEDLKARETIRREGAASAALAGPVDPEQYRLGPGDLLMLEYTGPADESKQILVDGEGRARLPNLGAILVAGRTLAEVRAQVLHDLKPFVPGAKVDLRLLEPRLFKVFVVGAVQNQGVATVRGSARVLEALDAAGGLADNASTRNIRVLRRGGQEDIADLQRFLWTGDLDANPYLEDGDRVVVPTRTMQVLVSGAVARPGVVEYRPGDRLSHLIRVTGGPLTEALLDSVTIVRFRTENTLDTLVVDFTAIASGQAEDTPIAEDDRIFVRGVAEWHLARQVTIQGEVMFPGIYAIEEGQSRVSDLIRWAGGFTERAARKAIRILRRPLIEGEDVEFDRLSRLARTEMTDTEYQQFRGKLAIRQSMYLVDFTTGEALPPESDVFLRDGDVVEAERLELAVRVDGSVERPGFVDFEPGLSVKDYIERAGGPSRRANMGDVRVTRAGSNVSQRAKGGWEIEPGDFVWVPEKKDRDFWVIFRDTIIVLGQIATVILVIDTVSR